MTRFYVPPLFVVITVLCVISAFVIPGQAVFMGGSALISAVCAIAFSDIQAGGRQ